MDLKIRIQSAIAQVRHEFAPDPRLAVFEVGVAEDGPSLRVVGAVSEPAALEALRRKLAVVDEELRDEVVRLPDPALASTGHALVCAAFAPLLAGPLVSEPHLSQAVLGHHLVVVRQRGRWLNVRGEDGYYGWVHRGYVLRTNELAARAWTLGGAREVYLSLGAELREENGAIVSRLPWGARFQADGTHGFLPNGLGGRLIGNAIPAATRRLRFPAEGTAIVRTAWEWVGTPYVWGGVTPAGADCSGFLQAVFRMHGVELPRDSDQQARIGEAVDISSDLSGLRPGDLLFFAEEPGRVSHVALSLGGSRILHSALGNGGIRPNDLAGGTPLEDELRRLLLSVRRPIPAG